MQSCSMTSSGEKNSKEAPEAASAAHGADLSPDQQQCMVAQGVEGEEGGQVPTGHLLAHQLQSHATWPCTMHHIMLHVIVLPCVYSWQYHWQNLNAVQLTGALLSNMTVKLLSECIFYRTLKCKETTKRPSKLPENSVSYMAECACEMLTATNSVLVSQVECAQGNNILTLAKN